MDNALKDASQFNWTSRWGTPVWTGPGYTLPRVKAWSWSVISPLEDENWTDPAGNRTAIGAGKVSHIWGIRRGGRRLTFWDPWLPLDQSYEMCGPHRGRFKSVNLSASGSFVFVIGRRGDLFTRLYDFDISGHDPIFFQYSYEDQRGKGDGAPIQLPAARWTEQPKIPGTITSQISIHKVGTDAIHRILRVEGRRHGRTGYWERDVAAPKRDGWAFHATGLPLTGKPLNNPRRDTSARGLGRSENRRYRMRGSGIRGTLRNYNVYCSPARLRLREDGDGATAAPAHGRRPAPAGPRPRPRRRAAGAVRGAGRTARPLRAGDRPGDSVRGRDRGAGVALRARTPPPRRRLGAQVGQHREHPAVVVAGCVVEVELGEDAGHVLLDRALGDHELARRSPGWCGPRPSARAPRARAA